MTKLKMLSLLAATALLPASLLAQAPPTASVHGHVTNDAGMNQSSGTVGYTQDRSTPTKDTKFKGTFPVDKEGDYKGTDLPPGDYYAYYMTAPGVYVDRMTVTLKKDEDQPVNFDMTRKEFIDKLSPEEKAELEKYKARIAETQKANFKINQLNNTLRSTRDDLASAAPHFDDDVKALQDASVAAPDQAVIWYNLGAAEIASADAKLKQDKVDHKPTSGDDAAMKLYSDGIDAYKKGVAINDASKKPNPNDAGIAYNAIGNAEAKLGKMPEATEAYDNAVKLAPASAAMVYYNEAAVMFNAGNSDTAAAAADKSIAADPTRPDPYYIKGQALITKATVDKDGKVVAPPGCVEAYQKYLELAPDGPHATEIKEVLTGLGQTITTKFVDPNAKKGGKAPVKVK